MRKLRTFFWASILGLAFASCAPKQADVVTFGICTDVHLPTMHDSEYRIRTFIDSMKVTQPDFIIELGDFIIPKEQYAGYFATWNSFEGEKFHVIGNHEMDGGTSREAALAYRNMKSSYYSFEKHGFHFIVLDGNDKKNPDVKGYQQFIGPEQVAWLKNDLENTKFPVIVFSHQGLNLYPGADENYGVENYREIQTILEKHNADHPKQKVIACFNGHTHWDVADQVNGIYYITLTSMAYHWLGDDYVHVRYSDEVDKNFKWIKYTAPFKEPLWAVVEISSEGYIKVKGRESEWVGPSPWELGYPEQFRQYMRPAISDRYLKF